MRRVFLGWIGCWLWAGWLGGCVTTQHHGHVFVAGKMEKVSKGTTKEDVIGILGTPTCVLPYDLHCWYYLSEEKETRALSRPRVRSILCYALDFASTGRLQHIHKSTEIISLCPSSHKIPLPAFRNRGVLKQIFRNVGRFPTVALPQR